MHNLELTEGGHTSDAREGILVSFIKWEESLEESSFSSYKRR